jgi:Arc/MetJ family transcription regulator
VIARSTLREFWTRQPSRDDARKATLFRYRRVLAADWSSPADLKADFGTASIHSWARIVLRSLSSTAALCRLTCKESHMATNLSIDPDLIERALEVSGERTKKAAVTRALEEFILRRRQKRLLDLMGKLEWDRSFDYKAGRSRS